MSTNNGPQQGPAAAPQRPSLMGAGPAAGGAEKQLSVLAALDGKPPAPVSATRSAKPWLAGLGLLVVVALGTAWALRGTPPSPAVEVAKVTEPAPAPAASAPTDAAAPPAAPASAAVAALEELPAAAASAAAPAAAVVAQAPAPRAAKPAPRSDKPAKPETRIRAKEKEATAKAPRAPDVRTVAAASAAPKDADVDLIAALVQHMSGESKGSDLTIADLVARCKSLQGGEAQRCQRRICENYWGRAEACPRSQAPNEVAARP